jgi:hypothetical protein
VTARTSIRRRAAVALLLACAAAPPLARAANDFIVKARWRVTTTSPNSRHVINGACLFTSAPLTPARPVNISPYSNDPRVRTWDPMLSLACHYRDETGDGYQDAIHELQFASLMDVGTWTMYCAHASGDPTQSLVVSRDANGNPTMTVPCCWSTSSCPPINCYQECYQAQEAIYNINAYNLVPITQPIVASPTTARCPGTLQLSETALDLDGGSVVYRWSVTAPNGSAVSVGTGSTVNLSLNGAGHVGTWQARVEVEDNEGELAPSVFKSVPVAPGPFTSTISGSQSVPVLRAPIALQVTSTACGTPTTTWDIVQSPPDAHLQPQNGYHTGPSLGITTTSDGDIGTWVFRATTVLGAYSDVRTYTVQVTNLPPRIELATTDHVMVGEAVRLETRIVEDDDGGALTFDWKLLQAPASAGVVPLPGFSTGPVVAFPTTAASAGTWIFELTVTDDDGQPNSTLKPQPITVLVDALPVADVVGPAYVEAWAALALDGSASLDPDSPCPGDPMRCHVTSGGPVQGITPGIASYAWSVTPPWELWTRFPPGRADDALGVDAQSALLQLDGLEAGDWTFHLDVVDGEGHASRAELIVTVLPPDIPPTVVLSPPARYVVSAAGNVSQPIVVSGAGSYDPDNFAAGGGPGAGIAAYHWNVSPPGGCAYAPTSQDGPATITLYPAGAVVPAACQGAWTVGLTVTDDDDPSRTTSGSTTLVIGNCEGVLCIDLPTTSVPRIVEAWDHTDVMVVYHLDSALYDRPEFAYGMMTRLDLFVAGDTSFPVYTSYDPNVNASAKGGFLTFNWNGYSRLGLPVPSGFYDVRVQLLDWSGTLPSDPAYADVEAQAIWMEVAELNVSMPAGTYVSRDALESGTAAATMAYQVTGALAVDEIRWRVRDAAGAVVHEHSDPGALAGTVSWNGRSGADVVPAGGYTLEVEAFRTSQLLASSGAVAFTIVSIQLSPGGATTGDVLVWVNQDDDDLNGVPDANEGASAAEDDIAAVSLVVTPPISGTLTMTAAAPAGTSRFWTTAQKGGAITAPWSTTLAAGGAPPEIFVEALAPARASVTLSFTTGDGVVLAPVARRIDQAEVRLVDGAAAAAPFVELGRWDGAYAWPIAMVYNSPGGQDLVERDPRRFHVEITDPGANDPAAPDAIGTASQERWVTVETRGRVLDAPVRVSLAEQGGDASGVLRSSSHLLVTEDHMSPRLDGSDPYKATDDAFEVVAGAAPGADGAPDDRTHQADISGHVRVTYHRGGSIAEHAVSVPVCRRGASDSRRRATVQPVVFRDPLLNGPSVDEAFVQTEVRRALLSWQQACMEIETRPTTYTDAPKDPVTGDDIFRDGYLDYATDIFSVYQSWKPASQDFVYVFFVPEFRGFPTPAYAVTAYPAANSWLGNDTIVFMQRAGAEHRARVLAHELGHVLENGDRDLTASPVRSEFYPSSAIYPDEDVLTTRRLTPATEANCRTTRTQPGGVGNVLLRPY